MNAIPSPGLRAYVSAGIVGLAAALAVGDPAPALIGAAFLALAVIGLAGGAAPVVTLAAHEVPSSTVEGEPITFKVAITTEEPMGRTHVDIGLTGLRITDLAGARQTGRSSFSLSGVRSTAEVEVTVEAIAWGRAQIGPLLLYTDTPLGMFDLRLESRTAYEMVALPSEATVHTLLAPLETNLHVGDLVSAHRGSGSEFADLRQFRPGDDPRSINWRVSSRADELWVNDRHPERNGDVLLLIDAQVEAGTGLEVMVDRSVRMASALLQAHARHHHRLGLITLDGLCRWVYPGMGEQHRRHLLEQLISITPGEVIWEAAERAVIRAARRPSMVIALTPLMDPNLGGLIHVLRRSGIDLSVVAVDVEPALPPPSGRARALGRRIWALERVSLLDRLAGEGVPVAVWRSIDPADVPLARLEEMRVRWRRHV